MPGLRPDAGSTASRLGGNEACHASLSQDGKFLLVANYNGAMPKPATPTMPSRSFRSPTTARWAPRWRASRHRGQRSERRSPDHRPRPLRDLRRPMADFVYVADLGIDRLVCLPARRRRQPHAPPGARLRRRHPASARATSCFIRTAALLFMVSELIPTRHQPCRRSGHRRADRSATPSPSRSLDGGIVQPAGILLTAGRAATCSSACASATKSSASRIDADDRHADPDRPLAERRHDAARLRLLALGQAPRRRQPGFRPADRVPRRSRDAARSRALSSSIAVGTPMSVKLAAF